MAAVTEKNNTVRRVNERAEDELRPVSIETGAMKFAEGSALIEVGDTRVLVAASIEKRVPRWLIDSGQGWVTAEYAMLPRATHTRSSREVSRGRPSGRSSEIQRLIGRSLRAVIDLKALANHTLTIDCDVHRRVRSGSRTAGRRRTPHPTAAFLRGTHNRSDRHTRRFDPAERP